MSPRSSDAAAVPSLPVGTALSLIGGLALVAAFWMPWLGIQMGTQGVLLSGEVLGRLLGGTADLRQFIPGSSGNPLEAQALRALIFLFPSAGVLAGVLALLEGWLGRRRWLAILLVIAGLVPLVGLLVGLTRLPPTASRELGLWVNGAGSVAVALGPIVNGLLAGRKQVTSS
ncbi:MAG: hypothetical protein U0893_01055 [Chloroflexota bacterium]